MAREMMTEEVIHEARFSVLLLQDSGGVGTGFVISQPGHILTCNHVVMGEMIQVVSAQGSHWTVPALVRDPSCDLAMLLVKDVETLPIDGRSTIPSVVSFRDDGSVLVGQAAKSRLLLNSESTVASAKRFMGDRRKFYRVDRRSLSPVDISISY